MRGALIFSSRGVDRGRLCQQPADATVDADPAYTAGLIDAELVVVFQFVVILQLIVGLKVQFEFQRKFQPEFQF